MMNCKKIVSLVMALVLLLGLLGCAGPAQSSKAESAVSKESSAESSAVSAISSEIVSSVITSSQATSTVEYVPQDRFEDENIINTALTRSYLSENPQIFSGSFNDAAKAWAKMFVKENYHSNTEDISLYQHANYALETESGIKEYFITGNCSAEFKSDFALEGLGRWNDIYFTVLQIVVKSDDNGYYTLVGFVTNQDNLIVDAYNLAEFLKGSPSFYDAGIITPEPSKVICLDSLGYDFIETVVDEDSGLSVINMRALTGGLYVYNYYFYPDDLLVVLAHDPEVENQKTLFVFEAEELLPLYQKTYIYSDTGDARFDYLGNSRVFVYASDEDNPVYYDITRTGVEKFTQTEIEKFKAPTQTYRLSDTSSIVDEKNCLYLEKNGVRKLLLEGFYPENPEDDDTGWENYNFYCRINDTRFIYKLYSYEWLEECGVYDLTTGEKTVFSHENAPVLYIQEYSDGVAVLVPEDESDYDSYGPYIYDDATGELTDLNWVVRPDIDANIWFSLIGDTLAVYIESEPLLYFKMLDLSTKTETVSLYFAASRWYYYFASKFCKTEHYIWFDSVVYFPSDYLLRIPIER